LKKPLQGGDKNQGKDFIEVKSLKKKGVGKEETGPGKHKDKSPMGRMEGR